MSWTITTLPPARLNTAIDLSVGSLSLCRFTKKLPVASPLSSPPSAIAGDPSPKVPTAIAPVTIPAPDNTCRRSIPTFPVLASSCVFPGGENTLDEVFWQAPADSAAVTRTGPGELARCEAAGEADVPRSGSVNAQREGHDLYRNVILPALRDTVGPRWTERCLAPEWAEVCG